MSEETNEWGSVDLDDLYCEEVSKFNNQQESILIEKIHALNELNLDQSFVTTKRELLEKLK